MLTALFLLAFWLLVWNQQRLEWTVNPLYSYGWAIPALAGYLLWERLRSAPDPSPHFRWLGSVAIVACALAFIPVRVIQEANPDWVRINWMLALLAIGATAGVIWQVGGWRWTWHAAFPLAFTLTALPWPVWFETLAQQELMRWNTLLSAEGLTLCGIPAYPQGNTIFIGGTSVDVEEACSGIRSLQTAFMMSLFLGEFYRFGVLRRLGLVVGSFVVAFLLNMGRTIALTYFAGEEGPAGVERWHDPLGNAVMIGCIAGLWGLAVLVAPRAKPATEAASTAPAAPSPGGPSPWRSLRMTPALVAIVLLGAGELGTQAWYGLHERALPAPVQWTMALPEEDNGFERREIAERTLAILKYNSGDSASWNADNGHRWSAYYFRWEPGRVSKFLSGAHYPEVCFPAAGMKKVADLEPVVVAAGDLAIPFRAFLFETPGGRPLYVFHALVEDRPATDGSDIEFRQVTSAERIASVRRGSRNLGQRVIGVTIRDAWDEAEARADFLASMPRLIRVQP